MSKIFDNKDLMKEIPTKPEFWKIEDMTTFLSFISRSSLKKKFSNTLFI